MKTHRPGPIIVFVVLLLVLPQFPEQAEASTTTLSTFKDGSLSTNVTFPDGGGWNETASIVLPAGASVTSARLEIAPAPVERTGLYSSDAASLNLSSPADGVQLKDGALKLAEGGWWWQAEFDSLASSGLNGTVLSKDGIMLGPAAYGLWDPRGFAPVARIDHTAVWDGRDGLMVVYGGWNLVNPQPTTVDLYSPGNGTWTQKVSAIPQRSDASAVWDDQDGLMLVFGGTIGSALGELWAYNPLNNTWARRAPGPQARAGHTAVWDGVRARMLVFGGSAGATVFGDLWAYYPRNDSWAPLGNYSAPSLSQHSAVYDPVGDRMLVFGGLNDTGALQNRTWTYDCFSDAWSQNANGPAPRQMHSAVFDSENGAMLVFGGNTAAGSQDDLWAYKPESDRWTRLMSGGSVRGRQSAVWAAAEASMIMLGGWSQFYNGTDLWSYRLLKRADGTASSPYIYPGAAKNGTLWVNLSIPAGTACSVDILSDTAPNGTVAGGLQNGDRFRIPDDCSSIRLSARMRSPDANLTPVLHGWGVGTRYIESFETPFGGAASGTEAKGGLALESIQSTVWEQMSKGPSPRSGASAVWDPDNGQLLIFGGVNGTTYYTDLWAYIPRENVWLRKNTGPPARAFHTAVWDPDGSTMLVFGGMNPSYQRDAWAYSSLLDSWTWKGLASIGNRARHCAVWDASSHLMLVFGGSSAPAGAAQYSNSLSAYDPVSNSWTPRAMVNNGRHSCSAVWDPLDHRMLVFGGRGPTGARQNDLWAYCPMNDSWELRDTLLAARELHSACWNPLTDEMLVAGGDMAGAVSETWSYSYRTNAWTPAPALPGSRSAMAIASDERGNAVLAFGGQDGSLRDECWMLSQTDLAWTARAAAPAPRTGHTAVWDSLSSQMLVFGGTVPGGPNNGTSGELLSYRPSTDNWTFLSPGAPPRVNHSAVWDERNRQMLVFGGSAGGRDLSDLWAYSPGNDSWTALSEGPPARSGASAVWCAGLDQMLVFGGYNATTRTALTDLWTYTPSSGQWVRRPDSPQALAWHSAVWDAISDRMLVFGGSSFQGATEYFQNTLLAYYPVDGQWMALGAGPLPRKAAAATMDPAGSRLLILGGQNNTTRFDGLWACSLPGGTWTLRPSGPGPRSGASAVWDPRSGLGYFFGGKNATGALDELWSWGRTYESSGSFLSPVRDLGRPASLGPARLASSVPDGTSLAVYLRSSQNNASWSQWELLGPNAGQVSTPPQRFVQWRASLTSTQPTFTPLLRKLELEFTRYVSTGTVGPVMAVSAGRLTSTVVHLDAATGNGTAAVFLSPDGVEGWVDAPQGTVVPFQPPWGGIAARISLWASPDGASPSVTGLSIDYRYELVPTAVMLRAGNGTLSAGDLQTNLTLDIAGLLNRFLSESYAAAGDIEIPLELYSATPGALVLGGLQVVCELNRPPSVELSGPADGASFHAASVRLSWSAQDPDGDPVQFTVRWSDRPFSDRAPVEIPVNGSSFELNGLAMNKTYHWTVSASDGKAAAEAPVRKFSTVNRPPVIRGVPPNSARVGHELVYNANATDDDNDPLAHHLVTPIAGMILDVATGELRWIPLESQKGNHTVSILVSDIFGAQALQQFTLVVADRYSPPVCRIDSPAEGGRAPRLLQVRGVSLPGALDVLRVEVRVDQGGWANATGTLEWNFTIDTSKLRDGRHIIEARAMDGTAFSESASVNISVQNTLPVTAAVPPLALVVGALLLCALLAAGFVLVGRRRRADAPPPAAPAGTSLLTREAYDVLPPPARSLITDGPGPSPSGGIGEKEEAFLTAVGDETAAGAVAAAPPVRMAAPGPAPGSDFLVEDVFLMYKDGRLIQHNTRRIKADLDLEVVTSMLRAVQIFVRESLGLGEMSELGSMEYGENKIVLQKGKHTILAVVVGGAEPADFRGEMRGVINDIEGEFGALLDGWNGATGPLAGIKKFLSRLGAYQVQEPSFERIHHDVLLQSELEFYQGFVRVKIAVRNKMPTVIRRTALRVMFSESSLRLDHIEPQYAMDGREILLGDIEPREKKAVALYLDPQICSESHLEGLFVFMDAAGRLDAIKLPRKLVSVVCPIMFTEHNINVAMLKRMIVGELDKKDSKVFSLPAHISAQDAFFIGKAAVEHHDLRLVRELLEPEPYTAEAWYFGNVKGREDRLVVRIRSLGDRRVLEFHVASTSTLLVTGLLAELKTDLNRELEARKIRDHLPQVTAAEQVAAIRQIRSLLDKASESEGAPTDTDSRGKGPEGLDGGLKGGHELLRP